jgi:hypothetical protein
MSSPLVAGDAFIANRWLHGSANVLWIGDSLSVDMEPYVFQVLRVAPAGWLVRGSSYATLSSPAWATLGVGGLGASGLLAEVNYSPFPTKEAVFNGTTVPTTGDPAPLDSRLISQSAEPFLEGTRNTMAFGGVNWLVGQGSLKLRSVLYRNSNSANGIVRNDVRSSSNEYKALGNFLNLNSASPAYLADDLAVIAPVLGEDLCPEAQSFEGATPTSGTNFVLCCSLLTSGQSGLAFMPASNVGWDVTKWLDTGVISDSAMAGALPLLGVTDVVIALGNYNTTSQTVSAFQTSLTSLVTRLRTVLPTASITFLPTYDTNNPGTNNFPHLSSFADAHYTVQQATANSCFLNLYAAAGSWTRINSFGYLSDAIRPNAAGACYFLQTIQSLLEQLLAGSGVAASGRYASQADVEDVFGVANVAQWSSQDDSAQVADGQRLQRALDYADAAIDDFFRGGPYAVPLAPSASAATVRRWAAVLAGTWLYQSRVSATGAGASASLSLPAGASFSAAVSSSSPYASIVTDVYSEMAAVKAGVIQIDSMTVTMSLAPSISQ